jgi:hypothetical protein
MPLYTYVCDEKHVTEHIVSPTARPETIECETCKLPARYEIISNPGMYRSETRKSVLGITGDSRFQDTKGKPVESTKTFPIRKG